MRELQLKFISSTVTVRWLRILNVIEREQNFTIVNLSERLEVSQRTLITDISHLKLCFEKSAQFRYISNRYTFKETDRMLYQEQKQALLADEVLFEIIGHIFYGEFETVTDLADYYLYSESTLRRFLVLAQKALIDYQLELTFNPVKIVGKEESIRKFFFDFYYEGALTPHTIHPPKDLHELLIEELGDYLGDCELGMGCTVTAFYYLLYIAMERSRQGFSISLPEEIKAIDYQERDFHLFFSIQGAIEKRYGVRLSKEEFCWVHYQVISRRTLNNVAQEQTFYARFNQWPELSTVTAAFLNRFQLTQEEQQKLSPFFHSFFLIRKYNDQISPVLNKLMEEEKTFVVTNYASEWQQSLAFLEEHRNVLGFSEAYFVDIAMSLALYSHILFHYYAPTRRILFLLEGDHLVLQYIRAQAEELLSPRHQIRYLEIQDLEERQLKEDQVDLLVTNYSPYISDYSLTKDYVLMKQIPDRQDWGQVLNKLDSVMERTF